MFKSLKDAAKLAKDLAGAVRNDLGGKAERVTQQAEDALGIERVRMQFMCGSVGKPYVVVMRRKRGEKFTVSGYEVGAFVAAGSAAGDTVSVETDTKSPDEFDFSEWACPCCHWQGGVGVLMMMVCHCGSYQCGSTGVPAGGGWRITCDACKWTGITGAPAKSYGVLKHTQSHKALPKSPQHLLLPKK